MGLRYLHACEMSRKVTATIKKCSNFAIREDHLKRYGKPFYQVEQTK
jgi:hypothetical protein